MSRVTTNVFILIALSICFLFLGMTKTYACDCDKPRSATIAMDKADAVFSGVVTEVKYLDDPKKSEREWRIVVTFTVKQTWKNVTTKNFVLHTVHNRMSCNGYVFEHGKEYLVFARKNEDADRRHFAPTVLPQESFGVRWCGGTSLLSSAKDYLAEMGKGTIP
jgi:hypothetical protein